MCFLQIKYSDTPHHLDIYNRALPEGAYKLATLPDTQLHSYLQGFEKDIDSIWLPLNRPYVTLCKQLPNIKKIVIPPEALFAFLARVIGEDAIHYMKEVAATTTRHSGLIQGDFMSFCIGFYQSKSRQEAQFKFHLWQEYMPLNDKMTYKMLILIERYQEELLNYFSEL